MSLGVLGVAIAVTLQAEAPRSRKTTSADLHVPHERYVTPNGLVVLLGPDPTVNHVFVDMSFAAGTLYEPEGKAGLAHLVEHMVALGTTPDVDYRSMLETRGAMGFNAFTTFDRMMFQVAVPPEALPLALWSYGDRLGVMPGRITPDEVERNRQIVFQERLRRVDDAPYGSTAIALQGVLFPKSHPLHEGVLGRRATLEAITAADVTRFSQRYLVPSNSVLVITGRFDPQVARELVDRYLASLPAGEKAGPAPRTAPLSRTTDLEVAEASGRRPKVTFAWAISEPARETVDALNFGALLLTILTNGLLEMAVEAGFHQYRDGALFMLEVTLPHVYAKRDATDNAEAVLRYLSRAMFPKELMGPTYQAVDRLVMQRLASPEGLAAMLARLETLPSDRVEGLPFTERHWLLGPSEIQETARKALAGPRLIIFTSPTRPLPKRVKPE